MIEQQNVAGTKAPILRVIDKMNAERWCPHRQQRQLPIEVFVSCKMKS